MANYRRILAPIELNRQGEQIVRRAHHMAMALDAQLVVLHAVYYSTGFESDHVPFLTPQQLQRQIAAQMQERLEQLLKRAGAAEVRGEVLAGKATKILPAFAREWRPDLIVLADGVDYGLQRSSVLGALLPGREPAWDILAVQTGVSLSPGRLLRWMTRLT
ncbi:MAG: universal stress protein [Thiohalophilus sp.]|uniref:universal stress protein n=1 Tax=Thiohalophilus sp. TaxID=3028392 RepID=UPI0028706748|nr:universal stress protein [Thiohalophilus sp.]MDR9437609.1 universal stress protein [Thiohalophilus sp.]